jgi:hypothetical protein
MAGYVPLKKQKEWEQKVGMAGYQIAAASERRIRARTEALKRSKDPVQVDRLAMEIYDRLVREGK